jgi:type VI secretion system protein VasD
MQRLRAWAVGLLVATAMMANGCATATCESPPSLKLGLQASDRVNPDDQGRALATVVRVYQLKSIAKLERAEFEDIWLRASDTLAGDLIKVDEFTLFPTDKLVKPLELDKDAAFVAAVALFRKPTGSSWRTIAELPAKKCNVLGKPIEVQRRFFLEDYRINIAPETAPGSK